MRSADLSLQSIDVKFFKSIHTATLDTQDFTAVVGRNAAGKSNIINVYTFLRDWADKGRYDAVQLQGGQELIFNAFTKIWENVIITASFACTSPVVFQIIPNNWQNDLPAIDETVPPIVLGVAFGLRHTITLSHRKNGFSSVEVIIADVVLHQSETTDPYTINQLESITKEHWCGDQLMVFQEPIGNTLQYKIISGKQSSKRLLPDFIHYPDIEYIATDLVIGSEHTMLDLESTFGLSINDYYSSFRIYDFQPKVIKETTTTRTSSRLTESGNNLNVVLHNILSDPEKSRSFLNLVQYALPHIEEITSEHSGINTVLKIREAYDKQFLLPAPFFSDGTVSVIALIVALFFEDSRIVAIEEPGRDIHPGLMGKVVQLCKEAAQQKKVIVTTHSPEFVKLCGIEDILFVTKNKDGYSVIRRPSDMKEVDTFINNELGLDLLFIENFFEA